MYIQIYIRILCPIDIKLYVNLSMRDHHERFFLDNGLQKNESVNLEWFFIVAVRLTIYLP